MMVVVTGTGGRRRTTRRMRKLSPDFVRSVGARSEQRLFRRTAAPSGNPGRARKEPSGAYKRGCPVLRPPGRQTSSPRAGDRNKSRPSASSSIHTLPARRGPKHERVYSFRGYTTPHATVSEIERPPNVRRVRIASLVPRTKFNTRRPSDVFEHAARAPEISAAASRRPPSIRALKADLRPECHGRGGRTAPGSWNQVIPSRIGRARRGRMRLAFAGSPGGAP